MFTLDAIANKNNNDGDKKWPDRMLIIGPSGSGKTNALLTLIQKRDNDSEKRENAGIRNLDNPSAFIEYSNIMNNVYNNIDDYNPKRERKILIVFDDMILDIMTNKKFQAIIKELFIRCRKLNIFLIFNTQSYFSVPKDLTIKINNRRELQLLLIILQILTTKTL